MPRRGDLIKGRAYPKVYIQIKATPEIDGSLATYDQEVLLAVELQQYLKLSCSVMHFIHELLPLVGAVLVLSEIRRVVSLNQFESILSEDLVYRGIHHDKLPRLERTRGRWGVEKLERGRIEQER